MKRYLLIGMLCLSTLLCMGQMPPARHHHRQPCAEPEQMEMVMQTLKKQSFDDGKLEIAKLCVCLGTFCVRDLERMAEVFSFDDNRLEFLKFAYHYCTDRENYPMLRDSFTFSSNFDKLLDYIYPKNPDRRR